MGKGNRKSLILNVKNCTIPWFPGDNNSDTEEALSRAYLQAVAGVAGCQQHTIYSSPDLNPVVGPAWMHCIVQG